MKRFASITLLTCIICILNMQSIFGKSDNPNDCMSDAPITYLDAETAHEVYDTKLSVINRKGFVAIELNFGIKFNNENLISIDQLASKIDEFGSGKVIIGVNKATPIEFFVKVICAIADSRLSISNIEVFFFE